MENKMKFALAMAFLAGMVFGWMTVSQVSAYSEKDGGWSASEKRQVISLLEKIVSNTAR